MQTTGNWILTEDTKTKYKSYFHQAQKTDPQKMNGREGRDFFTRSGLSNQDLAKIWRLSDRQMRGCLDEDDFCIAMAFIYARKEGQSIPDSIPDSLIISVSNYTPSPAPSAYSASGSKFSSTTGDSSAYTETRGSFLPPKSRHYGNISTDNNPETSSTGNWTLTEDTKTKYKSYFHIVQKSDPQKLNGSEGRAFFSRSGLSNQDLAKIWGLSDRRKIGWLDEDDFCVAMALIYARKEGQSIPDSVPENLMRSLYSTPGSNSSKQPQYSNNPSHDKSTGPQKEESTCVVCMEKPPETVIVDCGHLCLCVKCGNHMKFCPLCRVPISKIIKVFKV